MTTRQEEDCQGTASEQDRYEYAKILFPWVGSIGS
jgi:hypothetical protein